MFRYKLKLPDGTQTHGMVLAEDIANPWAGKLHQLKGWGYDGSNHTVEKEDISLEIADREQKRNDKANARSALKAMDLDTSPTRDIVKELVKALT